MMDEEAMLAAYEIASSRKDEITRLRADKAELLEAAQIVLAGLNARIDAAPSSAKPVFKGIAELRAAIVRATDSPHLKVKRDEQTQRG